MDNSKHMYDAWFDDILDDVRDNVLGEYWSKYLNYKYYREILKDLLHHSKLVHNHKYPSRSSVLHVNYDGDYELESPSKSVNYIEKYEVPENELNELHHVYYFILKQIVKTQGEEENMLTESNDKQNRFLDKVVYRLLKESMYRLWEDKNKLSSDLKKIRVEIIFALNNTWTEDPIEIFSMESVKSSAHRKRRRKKQYLEDYEIEQLNDIYGLNTEEMEEVIFNYYTTLYKNIYKSYLEMNEDDKVPTSKPEEWFRGDEVFDIGGRLNESLDSTVNKEVDDLFSKNKKLTNEKKIKSIFMDKYGMNEQDADQAMVIYLSKQQSLNESIDKQGRFLDRVIEQLVKETIIYTSHGGDMISIPGNPDEKWNAIKMFDHLDYLYNRFLTHTIKHCRDVYGLSDEEINYVWKNYFYEIKTNYYYQKGLNESTEKPKGFNLKYLFKVADSIMKEIEISNDNFKVRGFGTWSDMSTGGRGFWVGLRKHAKEIYGLTQAETEMVSDIVWDSLNAKNILMYNDFEPLREQHYEDWDERSREQNINLLKAKGIDILSTDPNVPFYKRIDSKEIRFLKKVVNMLDKESRIEVADGNDVVDDDDDGFDIEFISQPYEPILITPFGKFEYFDFMKEYRNSRFEKYVDDIYGVGDKQIMFPTHNSIAQARESAFLWEMFKEKLKIKQLRTIYPDMDIPDDAIITEQDLSDEQLKSLDKSFEYMDIPQEIATEELGDLITWVKDLPEELFLYRVLYLDDENKINYDELGSHYSQDRTDLINNHYDRGSIYGHAQGEDAYLITVKVPKSEVDVMETLNSNILYPHEKEITLKDKGKGATYLDIEKI